MNHETKREATEIYKLALGKPQLEAKINSTVLQAVIANFSRGNLTVREIIAIVHANVGVGRLIQNARGVYHFKPTNKH